MLRSANLTANSSLFLTFPFEQRKQSQMIDAVMTISVYWKENPLPNTPKLCRRKSKAPA